MALADPIAPTTGTPARSSVPGMPPKKNKHPQNLDDVQKKIPLIYTTFIQHFMKFQGR